MTLQELDSKIEMLDQAIDVLRNDPSYESGREAVKLMTERERLRDLRRQKEYEYQRTVPGLQESIAEMNRRLELLLSRTPVEEHASDFLIQQHLDEIKRLKAELAAKLGGAMPGDNAQFLPGPIV
jgi:hypothetical protein